GRNRRCETTLVPGAAGDETGEIIPMFAARDGERVACRQAQEPCVPQQRAGDGHVRGETQDVATKQVSFVFAVAAKLSRREALDVLSDQAFRLDSARLRCRLDKG